MKSIKILLLLLIGSAFLGCSEFLDAKPDKKLAIPTKLDELQGLLDNWTKINVLPGGSAEASADNYYISDATFNSMRYDRDKNIYLWAKGYFYEGMSNEWQANYTAIYHANTVIDIIDKIPRTELNKTIWDEIKGQAYFLRAFFHYRVANVWALAYDPASSRSDLGVVIRTTSDFNVPVKRSNVEDTYRQIIDDLHNATALLPLKAKHVSRASKPAAYALLARTHLAMGEYGQALANAEICLSAPHELMDFNLLDTLARFPFKQFNPEVIFWMSNSTPQQLGITSCLIDTVLLRSYFENDLRKKLYFTYNPDGTVNFKGSYDGTQNIFGGLAIDEVYFIRAECLARNGEVSSALEGLNAILRTRWESGKYLDYAGLTKEAAVDLVLDERRKSLLMRDLRWMDIKRLNKEGRGIVLKRNVDGREYILKPNDYRYALPLPEDVVEQSKVPQNKR